MRTRNAYLGIRPTFEGRYSREGTETEFDIVAVDAAGKQVARPGHRIQGRAHRLELPVVRGRRALALAFDRQRPADHGRHRVAQRHSADAAEVQAELGLASPDRHRPPERHDQHDAVLCRLVRRLRQRRGDARHAARGQRQGELCAGRDRARAHRGAVRGRGDAGHRHRPHHQHPERDRAGRRHDRRRAGVGRLGSRRLCAGHRLAAARQARRSHADARHRPHLARARAQAAHARHRARHAGEDHAAPAHRGADQGRQSRGRGSVRHPGGGR